MLISTFYFSGTGNTRWVVEELNKIILEKGYKSKIYSIEEMIDDIDKIVESSDLIGIAYPIYGANIPNIMLNFIRKIKVLIPSSKEKPFFIMSTAGYVDGFGPYSAMKLFKGSEFKLKGYINLKISNNTSTPMAKANPVSGEKLVWRMEKAQKELRILVNKVTAGKRHIKNIGPYLLPGIVIRRTVGKARDNCYLQLSVNNDTCKKCMLCVNNCPTKSIEFSNDQFTFLPTCTACMRCYNFCPTYSIFHEGQYADPAVYIRYKGPVDDEKE